MIDFHWLWKYFLKSDWLGCYKSYQVEQNGTHHLIGEVLGYMLDGYRKSVPFFQTHFIPWQSLTSSMKPVQFKQTDPILKCVFNTVVVSHLAHETNCKTALSNWMKAWNSIQFDSIQEKKSTPKRACWMECVLGWKAITKERLLSIPFESPLLLSLLL